MDFSAYNNFDRSSLINELTRGVEVAKQLKVQMGPEYSVENQEMLLQQMISSYDKALLILGWGGVSEPPHQLLPGSSPLSAMESSKSDDRSVQGCWATKQVQRSDEDPTVLNITYKGKHTCNMPRRSKSAPTSPAKQEHRSGDLPIAEYHTDSMTLNFQNTISADVQSIDSFLFSPTAVGCLLGESPSVPPSTINLTSDLYGSISQSLISPETSGSNFFFKSLCTMDTLASVQHPQQNFERDITEILSAATSVTNSPAIDLVKIAN